jgi:hypothetical protein
MLYEFALDPAAISDKASARYFFESFRPEKGRLISQFPAKWKKKVFEHCKANIPDGLSSQYIIERLRKLDGCLVKSGRLFDPDLDWVVNAVAANGTDPFRAIISPTSGPGVFSPDIDEDVPEWNVETAVTAGRRSGELAAVCAGMLKTAKELILVDPYFSGSTAQVRVLNEILDRANQGLALERIEYHVKEQMDAESYATRLRVDVLPSLQSLSVPVYVIRWQNQSETLHDRYILTNLAGINVAQGLSECRREEADTTDVSLLGKTAFELRRSQYSAKNDGNFKFVDGWCIQNGQVSSVKLENGQWVIIGSFTAQPASS